MADRGQAGVSPVHEKPLTALCRVWNSAFDSTEVQPRKFFSGLKFE